MLIFIGLIAITILFMISIFWAAAETSLTKLSRYKIKKLIALNKPLALPLEQWIKSPYYLLTTILVGNTITNIAVGFIGTLIAVQVFDFANRNVVEFFSWIVVTFFLVVFCELTPKIFARSNPEKGTIFTLPILFRVEQFTRPFVYPLKKIAKLFFPRVDILPPVGRYAYLSLEEIKVLITEAGHAGIIGKETSQMLERVIHFGDLSIEKIMTPIEKVESVKTEDDQEKFLDLVVETGRSRVPVFEKAADKITGFVYLKDVLWAWRNNNGKFTKDLIRPPYFVKKDKKVYELLNEFQSGRMHMAFVEDSLGNLLGIVTLEDILEEIIGEVLDEYLLERNR